MLSFRFLFVFSSVRTYSTQQRIDADMSIDSALLIPNADAADFYCVRL